MTYVEDALSGIIIVVPDGDALARARVFSPPSREDAPREAPRRDLISRLLPRKSPAET